MLVLYMKPGKLPYRLIYPQGKLPTHPKLGHMPVGLLGLGGVVCRGRWGVLDAVGAGRKGRACRGDSVRAETYKHMQT